MGIVSQKLQSQNMFGLLSRSAAGTSGAIVETDSVGNFIGQYLFPKIEGGLPYYAKFLEVDSGIFYSTTYNGSNIFEYNALTNTYTNKYSLKDNLGEGRNPFGGLIMGSNGKMYGMTNGGGTVNGGVIYEYDHKLNKYKKLYDFQGGVSGGNPKGDLLEVSAGIFYGLAFNGGANSAGVIFEFNANTLTYTKKFDFSNTNGISPYGSLIKASNGLLYGTAYQGGASSFGVLFSFNTSNGTYTKLQSFAGVSTGSYPFDLIEYSTGVIYGNTTYGGVNNFGTIFKYEIGSNTLTKVHDFSSTTGKQPFGLMKAKDGNIYGVCNEGGAYSSGNIFKFNPNTLAFQELVVLGDTLGARPACKLLQAKNGHFYGTTILGGLMGQGIIFDYDAINNKYTAVVQFSASAKGSNPYGELLQLDKENYLGACQSGGVYNKGTLFIFNEKTKSINKIFDFNGQNGQSPTGKFTKVGNTRVYSLTYAGGKFFKGVLFEYLLDQSKFTKLIDFNDTIGFSPRSKLVEAKTDVLYGTTSQGGSKTGGTLFSYHVYNKVFNTLYSFDSYTGNNPVGDICLAKNGKVYGTTSYSGPFNEGGIYEFNPTDKVMKLLAPFADSLGTSPESGLMQASNNLLYGTLSSWGNYNNGLLYSYDINTKKYTQLYHFSDSVGASPEGELLQAKNSKIYGTFSYGGITNFGNLYEYDINTNKLFSKVNYHDSTFSQPSGVMQRKDPSLLYTKSSNKINSGLIYPNPTNGIFSFNNVDNKFNEFTLLNFNGETIEKGICVNGVNILNISNISNGFYLLILKDKNNNLTTTKIIKN